MPKRPKRREPWASSQELRTWTQRREDWPTLSRELARTGCWLEELWKLLPALRADRTLARFLSDHLPPLKAEKLNELLRRRSLAVRVASLPEFCALATERARLRQATFPGVRPDELRQVVGYPNYSVDALDARVDGIGWTLEVTQEAFGPAEIFVRDTFAAIAHGDGWKLAVRLQRESGSLTQVWEEAPQDG